MKGITYVKAFVPNAPFLHPLKTSENLTVFWYFQGEKKGALGTNGQIKALLEYLKQE